jgi:FKBP-type peptidyl-prolyl cis-trans isomerase
MKWIALRLAALTRLGALTLLTLVAACGSEADRTSDPEPQPVEPTQESYAPELGIDLDAMTRTGSGLYLQDLAVGEGARASAGFSVAVNYTGWFVDGESFDSNQGREPFTVVLGRGMVIPGWDEGLQGMREGGRRKLVIPHSLAYGAQGHPAGIPPYSTLVFEVELLSVEPPR